MRRDPVRVCRMRVEVFVMRRRNPLLCVVGNPPRCVECGCVTDGYELCEDCEFAYDNPLKFTGPSITVKPWADEKVHVDLFGAGWETRENPVPRGVDDNRHSREVFELLAQHGRPGPKTQHGQMWYLDNGHKHLTPTGTPDDPNRTWKRNKSTLLRTLSLPKKVYKEPAKGRRKKKRNPVSEQKIHAAVGPSSKTKGKVKSACGRAVPGSRATGSPGKVTCSRCLGLMEKFERPPTSMRPYENRPRGRKKNKPLPNEAHEKTTKPPKEVDLTFDEFKRRFGFDIRTDKRFKDSYEKSRKKLRRFHEMKGEPEKVKVLIYDDGDPNAENWDKVHAYLGEVADITYSVDPSFTRSNKHQSGSYKDRYKDGPGRGPGLWHHKHRKVPGRVKHPILAHDPDTDTARYLQRGSVIDDWMHS